MPIDSEEEPQKPKKAWPDLGPMDEFAIKETKDEFPQDQLDDRLVDETATAGPLRPPRYVPWTKHGRAGRTTILDQYRGGRSAEYRYSYFRDDLPATIHSPTLSGLLQPGQSFENLFSESNTGSNTPVPRAGQAAAAAAASAHTTPPPPAQAAAQLSKDSTYAHSPIGTPMPDAAPNVFTASHASSESKGPFWLDALNPTEEELRVLSKSFGIHPLTTEDILLRETREKVELFHHYYFICFASFDIKQGVKKPRRRKMSSSNSEHSGYSSRHQFTYEKLRPLAVYIIVFKTGVITVHYSPTPHTINVRRRIRLLRDYLNVTSDWISYALIDDIVDGFAPIIVAIEEDVQGIDDAILHMHGSSSEEESDGDDDTTSRSSTTAYRQWRQQGDMLRWIGETRKRVMNVLGLLGSKADVIKGFSKRVTEQWSGASRQEIAMYLSDIQDHLVTMVQSLNHYEKLLARSHSNYLAQINIDMTKANNDMNDVLGQLSILGTIVLPMNIITGLWGMNVLVPGQGREDSLVWFWSIVFGMLIFGVSGYFVLKRYI